MKIQISQLKYDQITLDQYTIYATLPINYLGQSFIYSVFCVQDTVLAAVKDETKSARCPQAKP